MNYKITGYKPEKLFHFFEDISAIPRGSANEKAISDYLVAFAEKRNLWYHRDALFNVIIKKPASAGAKEKPAVMLQGHKRRRTLRKRHYPWRGQRSCRCMHACDPR